MKCWSNISKIQIFLVPIRPRWECIKALLKLLQKENAETLLKQFQFYKKAHKTNKTYQLWQEGYQPKLIQTYTMMLSKIKYIHENPVKRGYVNDAVHWRYSSARNSNGLLGLIEVERFW